jgi:hypothetical protein
MAYRMRKVTDLVLRKDGNTTLLERCIGLYGYQKCKQANLIEDKEGCRHAKSRSYNDIRKARNYASCMVSEGRMRGFDRKYWLSEDHDICGNTYYTVHRSK